MGGPGARGHSCPRRRAGASASAARAALPGWPRGPSIDALPFSCALYEENEEAWVVLTRRSPRMRSHTHEVSFPGGRIDPGDDDEWAAAVREAQEEVALDPALPRRIGELDSFVTGGSESFVTPVVAALPARPHLVANEAEVEHILHVPLRELLRPEVFREELWTRPGRAQFAVTFFELVGDTVWGPRVRCCVNSWPSRPALVIQRRHVLS